MEVRIPHNWRPRPYQLGAWGALERGIKRVYLVWHRRSGKDDLCLHWTCVQAVQKPATYWHMLPQANQARKAIWDAVNPHTGLRRIDEAFPAAIRASTRDNDMLIRFRNGATWQVVGSDNYKENLVGSGPFGVVFSEYKTSNPDAWAIGLSPMLTENGGWAIFNTTPEGRNHAFKLYHAVLGNPAWYCETLTVDDTGVITKEQIEAERATLTLTRGKREADAIINQEYFCLPPGTDIWTDKGQRPIEDIRLNDVVLTHAGRWRKVTRLYQHANDRPLVSIRSAGSCVPLVCTDNHPVRVCDVHTQSYRWVPAGDVKPGDHVVLPRLKMQTVSLLDAATVEMIGWFIAEGSVAKTLVQFSLNKTETHFAARIAIACKGWGKVYSFEGDTALSVIVNSAWLADFLTTHCGSGAANKHIPWSLIGGHENLLYETLLDGDGCRGDWSGRTEMYSTISRSLALDVQMLAHMLGRRARIYLRPKEKQADLIEGRRCVIADSYSVEVAAIRKTVNGKPFILPQKHGVAALVRTVETLPACPTVYNFSVQFDESYVASGRVVHNCSWDAAIPGSIYGPEMKLAEEEGRVLDLPYDPRVPVTTAWDLGGNDPTAIIFGQANGEWIDLIDHLQASNQKFSYFAKQLNNSRDYAYKVHLFPHDGQQKHQAADLGTSVLTAKRAGINPIRVVPRSTEEMQIRAAHALFPKIRFDRRRTEALRDSLVNFQYEWNADLGKFDEKPRHDWASHDAKSFAYFCQGFRATGYDGAHGRAGVQARPVTALMEYDELG